MKTNRRIFNQSIASLVAAIVTPNTALAAQDSINDVLVPIKFPFFQNSDGFLSASITSVFELERVFDYGQLELTLEHQQPEIDVELTFYLDETKTIERTLIFKTNKSPTWTNISEDFKKKSEEKIWYTSLGFNLFQNKPINPAGVVIDNIFDVEIVIESSQNCLSKVLLNECRVIKMNDYKDGVLCLNG